MAMLVFFFVRISFFVGIDTIYQATLEWMKTPKAKATSHRMKNGVL